MKKESKIILISAIILILIIFGIFYHFDFESKNIKVWFSEIKPDWLPNNVPTGLAIGNDSNPGDCEHA
tara:strand:- start:221 stop:424 length:204 start_codon:yes stop_codon:yes gene_type:complete